MNFGLCFFNRAVAYSTETKNPRLFASLVLVSAYLMRLKRTLCAIQPGNFAYPTGDKFTPAELCLSFLSFINREVIMGIYDMKAFYRFLESASDEELKDRKQKLFLFLQEAVEEDSIKDAKHYLREVEVEILSRINSFHNA